MAEFLFEIGLEEVPARMIAGAEAELKRRTVEMLLRVNLWDGDTDLRSFSTPRRLAVIVPEVHEGQSDRAKLLVGPSWRVGFKDGQPTKAGLAFMKKAGLSEASDLVVETRNEEQYMAALVTEKGRAAAEVIAEEMPKELAGIYWAKNMVWRAGRPERFVRPVRWLLALLGSEVVPVSFGGFTACNTTRGHRVLAGDAPIEIARPGDYEHALLGAHVIADVEARRHKIRKALDRVCRTVPEARWREDHALVDTVTHLTEWPSVVLGSFEPEYLALPEEVLVTVMRDHQKFFAVEDPNGKLAPHFLTVLNTETDAAGEAVIRHGNERVLRARFNDARFFWEFDQRVPLTERVALLEKVTFQKDLGSYAAKTERVLKICEWMYEVLNARGLHADGDALLHAATLAKTDLTTELVKEFTELQGEVGGLYASAQGFGPFVADAIYDHYRPMSTEDHIPRTTEGQLLAIADKADTIAGMFSLGMEPTGSRDPFALRRAANGIVKILAEGNVPLELEEITTISVSRGSPDVVNRMILFLFERVEFYLRDARGFAYDVVKAVLAPRNEATRYNDVRDAVARAEAVTAVRGSEDFAAVSAAFKRMKNILAQAQEKGMLDVKAEPAGEVQMHPAQSRLLDASVRIAGEFKVFAERREYVAALELMASLRAPIDEFFDQVMVMDPDPYVRNTRLSLLGSLVKTFTKIADFSEIVTAG